ncbi:hypothetical protein [Methylobacterium oxalidis]|uniref:Uncharacterized protein n=1 Tax=Methylobacterium oxalidis TaxID=944322 RepID=A0A512JBT1_9HYPH|nr:hypothetical protein [Methylobacterium oxalidis]GEP07406.1 hypothetical protein MOX02_54440 [Methylobacterium oxalidis]GJE35335.1 hypothetical protein LDDCCGHA_5553 [Methylobacterium oxalidis]GLS67648.1 hypothetical protein GCM10007888_60330 [Methylobacterium oxalidis]
MDFQTTSRSLALEYEAAGWPKDHADRIARGQTLIAKVENATTIDEMRDVLRDMIRDLYALGQPVPRPFPDQDERQAAVRVAAVRR